MVGRSRRGAPGWYVSYLSSLSEEELLAHCERIIEGHRSGVLRGSTWEGTKALTDPPVVPDPGLVSEVMEAPEERVKLVVTVHAPIETGLLADLARAVSHRYPDSRAEAVDGETDIVFVLPLPPETREVPPVSSNGVSHPVVVDVTSARATDPDPGIVVPITPAVPRVGDAAVGTAEAPVILDPSWGDAETRARRLKAYLDSLDLDDGIPDDREKAKDAHRRGVSWQDSRKRWHCPWCPETWKMAAHAGRHRPGCRYRPGERLDRARLDSAGVG